MKIYILYVFLSVNSGHALTTVEHNSLKQCEYAAKVAINTKLVATAYCLEK